MSLQSCRLRPATAEDADSLSTFAANIFPLGGRPNADPAHIAHYVESELAPTCFRNHVADQNAVLTIAECDGAIAGFSMLLLRNPHAKIPVSAAAELRKFYVCPTHHGSGLAKLLMQAVLEQLAPATECVWLSVFSENFRAIAFYKKWGFEITARHVFQVGDDAQEDFLMIRNLSRLR
jgi:tRNA (guanine37-N1)-methyltransferase